MCFVNIMKPLTGIEIVFTCVLYSKGPNVQVKSKDEVVLCNLKISPKLCLFQEFETACQNPLWLVNTFKPTLRWFLTFVKKG